jgi:hypothetical protein
MDTNFERSSNFAFKFCTDLRKKFQQFTGRIPSSLDEPDLTEFCFGEGGLDAEILKQGKSTKLMILKDFDATLRIASLRALLRSMNSVNQAPQNFEQMVHNYQKGKTRE